MVNKRGRKRTNEMYFGPEEEEAVVKFLKFREIKTIDLVKGKPIKIEHNLGLNISIDASYIIPNENAYGSDSKFIEIDVPLISEQNTDTSVVITSDVSVTGVTVIVVDVINRDLIFNEHLKAPLDKMVESIIRRYKLYRKGETFEDLHGDTLSFLMTKVHKFEAGRGKKAYSYFGTIAKHYILGLLIKDEKYMKQNYSYEDMSSSIEEREDLTYVIDNDGFMMDDFIGQLSNGIKDELDDENQPPKKKLNDNERKVGLALIEILENWETAFESMEGGSKYNKNSVLETMRNYTNLSTKDIRLAMKRFKDMYELLKLRGL
jgi:hypothetical protein